MQELLLLCFFLYVYIYISDWKGINQLKIAYKHYHYAFCTDFHPGIIS